MDDPMIRPRLDRITERGLWGFPIPSGAPSFFSGPLFKQRNKHLQAHPSGSSHQKNRRRNEGRRRGHDDPENRVEYLLI